MTHKRNLNNCTSLLSQNSLQRGRQTKSQKAIKATSINHATFLAALPSIDALSVENNPEVLSKEISDALNQAAKDSIKVEKGGRHQSRGDRWRNILESNNPKDLWRAINWRGEFDQPVAETCQQTPIFASISRDF